MSQASFKELHVKCADHGRCSDADVNGMLGGFPYISKVDLQGSKNFLAKLGIGGRLGRKVARAVDCGAGLVYYTLDTRYCRSG
jgi:protein N-terminal methyltransferase